MISQKKLVDTFLDLALIDGASGNERLVADFLKSKLSELGLNVKEDNANKTFNGNAGNVIAHYPGTNKDMLPYFIAAHMDSIAPTKNLKPVFTNGVIRSDGTTILGADDRVGVAVVLETITYIVKNKIETGPIQIILTVGEEIGMFGSKNLTFDMVNSRFGFVFDSSASPGSIIVSAPSSTHFIVKVLGKAAHAAVNPEQGINAIKIASDAITKLKTGKISETCTMNFGLINGGKAINIVPDQVIIEGDVRSLVNEESISKIEELKDTFNKSALKFGGKVEFKFIKKYETFNLSLDSNVVQIAMNAIKEIGLNPKPIKYPGGSDANIFNKMGIPTVNLGLGYKNVHSKNESISIQNLELSAKIGISIVKNALFFSTKNELAVK